MIPKRLNCVSLSKKKHVNQSWLNSLLSRMDLKSEKTRENQPCLLYQSGPRSPMRSRTSSSSLWEVSRKQREDGLGFHFICLLWWRILKTDLPPPSDYSPPSLPNSFSKQGLRWAWCTTRPPLWRATHGPRICPKVELPSLCTPSYNHTLPWGQWRETGMGSTPKPVALLSVFYFSIWETQWSFFFPLLLKFWKCKVQSLREPWE